MQNMSPNGRYPANSPWRMPIRLTGDLAQRLVMMSKPGSATLAVREKPRRRSLNNTYTDY
jgi:hypothetical protein